MRRSSDLAVAILSGKAITMRILNLCGISNGDAIGGRIMDEKSIRNRFIEHGLAFLNAPKKLVKFTGTSGEG
jgi:hypothetical protein